MEAARQTALAERARLAQIEHNLIFREQALVDSSRPRQRLDPSVVRCGRDINNNFAVGGIGDLCILCTPIDNVRAAARLVDAIQ